MVELAHVGHWAAQLIWVAPILVMFTLLAWGGIRDRRRGASPPSDEDEPSLEDILDGRTRPTSSAPARRCADDG